jgi:transcriptional regulator with XRE-family HTH domain
MSRLKTKPTAEARRDCPCRAGARRRASLTQQELAKRLDKPQSFISDYERGQRRVDLMEFLAIARGLDADPEEIFLAIVQAASA